MAPSSQAPDPTSNPITQLFTLNNKVTKRELFRFLFYVILLFIIAFQNLDIVSSYAQNTYFLSLLSENGNLNQLAPTYTSDINSSLESTILNLINYNENSFIASDSTNFNSTILLKPITDLRIVQKRVNTTGNSSIIWKNPLEELKTPFGLNSSHYFQYSEELKGYPVYIPLFFIEDHQQDIRQMALKSWEGIKGDGYFDAHTKEITMDFSYISLSLDIISYMKIHNEIKPSGVAKTVVDVRTFNYSFFGANITVTQTALSILYVILFGYYFIVMFIKIYYDIRHVELDDTSSKAINPSSPLHHSKSSNTLMDSVFIKRIKAKYNQLMDKCKGPRRFILRVVIGLKRHLTQINNLIDLFVNIMNFFVISLTIKLLYTDDFFQSIDSIAENSYSGDFLGRNPSNSYLIELTGLNDKLDLLSIDLIRYQMFTAMIILVQCFKIFIYVIGFSNAIQRFFAIISNILDVLFFYLLLIAVIFLSFVLLVRNFFGYQIPEFTNVYSVSVYLFGMISGYNAYLTIMWNNSPEFTLFFQIAFNFIIVFILMNMFLVIVKNEFSRFQLEMKKKQEQNEQNINSSRFDYKISFISQIKDKLHQFHMGCIRYIDKEGYSRRKKLDFDQELQLKNDINLYSHIDFDIDFIEMLEKYKTNQEKNVLIETEKTRLSMEEAKKSVKGLWQLMFLMIGLGLYIFLVTGFFQTEENYYLSSSVIQSLDKPYVDPKDPQTTFSLSQATNMNDVLYYLSYELPSLFSQKLYYTGALKTQINSSLIKENPSFNEFLFLANKKIRFTVRKRQAIKNQNAFKKVIPYLIAPSFSYSTTDPSYELTETITLPSNTSIPFDKAKSFNGYGGYTFFNNPNEALQDKILYLTENRFFNKSLSSITIDFVLVHIIKNKFVYVLIIFQFSDTGGVEVIYQALPFRRINFSNTLDICITVLLTVIVMVYFVSVVKFIKAVFFKAESYRTWYLMFIKNTIPESLLHHRERKTPELFRKIIYVFDFKSLLNIFFFVFTGVFIFLMAFLQVSVLEIENKTSIFGVDLSELMKLTTWRMFENPGDDDTFIGDYMNLSVNLLIVLDSIAVFAAFSAFVMVFQILYYYSKKNSFFVIIHSILISLKEIPFMIAVLLSFLFTFALYGFLLIGKLHPKFNSFPNAVRTLFEYLTHIEDIDFFMQDSAMLPFFTLLIPFFLSVKLVIINMFFSIIYRSYEKAKTEGKTHKRVEQKLGFKAFWTISYALLARSDNEKDHSLEMYNQLLQKTEMEGLFLRMKDTIRISNQNTNIHIWANICSEEIRNEHEKRGFLKEKCDEIMKNYFFKNSQGEHKYFKSLGRNLNKKCVEYELRKGYWDYFRIAHQYLNRYDYYFRNRITELNGRLEDKQQLQLAQDEGNTALKGYIGDLVKRMEENKRDLEFVKQEIRRLRIETEEVDEEDKSEL